jgi:hypothetical protein
MTTQPSQACNTVYSNTCILGAKHLVNQLEPLCDDFFWRRVAVLERQILRHVRKIAQVVHHDKREL